MIYGLGASRVVTLTRSPLLHSRDGFLAASLSPNSPATPPPSEARRPSSPTRRSLDPLPPAWNLANHQALSGGRQCLLGLYRIWGSSLCPSPHQNYITSLVILKCETAICSQLRTRPARTGIFAFNHGGDTPCREAPMGRGLKSRLTRGQVNAVRAAGLKSRLVVAVRSNGARFPNGKQTGCGWVTSYRDRNRARFRFASFCALPHFLFDRNVLRL